MDINSLIRHECWQATFQVCLVKNLLAPNNYGMLVKHFPRKPRKQSCAIISKTQSAVMKWKTNIRFLCWCGISGFLMLLSQPSAVCKLSGILLSGLAGVILLLRHVNTASKCRALISHKHGAHVIVCLPYICVFLRAPNLLINEWIELEQVTVLTQGDCHETVAVKCLTHAVDECRVQE